MRKKFEQPPLTELIIGMYFNPAFGDFRAEHVGQFWNTIQDEYPKVEQKEPLNNQFTIVPFEVVPLPRFWFIALDDIHLVQLQRDTLILNWRKRDKIYPHFEIVKSSYDKIFDKFINYLRSISKDVAIVIDRCELTYLNQISTNEYWSCISDTSNIIPSFQAFNSGHSDGEITAVNCLNNYKIAEDLELVISVRSGSSSPDGTPLLSFEIRAVGINKTGLKKNADEWFQRAHDAVQRAFLSLTNKDIQERYWKPIEALNDNK